MFVFRPAPILLMAGMALGFMLFDWVTFLEAAERLSWPPYPGAFVFLGTLILTFQRVQGNERALRSSIAILAVAFALAIGLWGALGLLIQIGIQALFLEYALHHRKGLVSMALGVTIIGGVMLYGAYLGDLAGFGEFEGVYLAHYEQMRSDQIATLQETFPDDADSFRENIRIISYYYREFFPARLAGTILIHAALLVWALSQFLTEQVREELVSDELSRFRLPDWWLIVGFISGGYLLLPEDPWRSLWFNALYLFLLGLALQGLGVLIWYFDRLKVDRTSRWVVYMVLFFLVGAFPPVILPALAVPAFDMRFDFRKLEAPADDS